VLSLPADQRAQLDGLAGRIADSFKPGCKPTRQVTLVGHADLDPTRTRAFEKDISEKRARQVRAAIEKKLGAAVARKVQFAVSGVGSTAMKHKPAQTELQREENRRVLASTRQ
jgi:outer membrane protein OmpA-like peptidoglycan-associated protein